MVVQRRRTVRLGCNIDEEGSPLLCPSVSVHWPKITNPCKPRICHIKSRLMKRALLIILVISTLCLAQPKNVRWQEISYPADGFAVTIPFPPVPHPDAQMADTNTYPVYFPGQNDVRMTIRVKHQVSSCGEILNDLKIRIAGKSDDNSQIEASSIKELFLNGHEGVEYRWRLNSSTMAFERHYCGDDGRLYVFSAGWPKELQFPNSVQRVLDSFRPVTPQVPK
jgi:hypothetical protein